MIHDKRGRRRKGRRKPAEFLTGGPLISNLTVNGRIQLTEEQRRLQQEKLEAERKRIEAELARQNVDCKATGRRK